MNDNLDNLARYYETNDKSYLYGESLNAVYGKYFKVVSKEQLSRFEMTCLDVLEHGAYTRDELADKINELVFKGKESKITKKLVKHALKTLVIFGIVKVSKNDGIELTNQYKSRTHD